MNTDKNLANGRVKREPSQRLDENNFNICSGLSLIDQQLTARWAITTIVGD